MSYPDLAEKHLNSAHELLARKKSNAAFREFRKAIQLRYDDAGIYARFGSALVDAGRYREAIGQFLEALKADPACPFEVGALENALDRDSRQEEDIAMFQKVVDAGNHADLFHRWGQILASLSRHDQAIEQFKKALGKNPELDVAIQPLQKALEGSDTTEQQVKAFQEEVERLQNTRAWNIWGKTLTAMNKYSEAISLFEKATAVPSPMAEVYYNWGETLYKRGAYQEAVKILEKAIDRDHSYIQAYLLLGLAQNQLEHYPDANATYQCAMTKAPSIQYLDPWQKAIRQLPDSNPVIAVYQRALAENYPAWKDEFEPVYYNAGDFLMSLGRLEESAIQYARSLQAKWNVSEIREKLSDILAALPDSKNTMLGIQRIVDEAQNADAYIQWGLVLVRMNNNEQALQQLSSALQLLPGEELPWVPSWFGPLDGIKELFEALPVPSWYHRVAHSQIEKRLEQFNKSTLWIHWGRMLRNAFKIDRQPLESYCKALVLDPSESELVKCFTEILKDSPNQFVVIQEVQAVVDSARRPDVYYTWGRILCEVGKQTTAIDQFQQAIRLKHDFAEVYHYLGKLYTEQGDYREACDQFRKSVEYKRDNVDALFDWGTALFQSARQDEAVQKYLQAIRMSPQTLERLHIIGDLLKQDDTVVRRFQSSIDDIRTAASYTQWGALLARIGRYEQAIQQHHQAVQLDPDLEEAYTNWLETLGRAGISAERIQTYDKVIEEYSKNADAYRQWGKLLFNLNWAEQAEDKYEKALENDTKHADARIGLIQCLMAVNDITRVRDESQRLLSYYRHWYAYYSLAYVAYLDGNYDESIRQCALGIQHTGHNVDLYDRWAWALYQKSEDALAVGKLKEAVREFEDADSYYLYGNLLLELGRQEDAAFQFGKAIELDPSYAFARHNFASIPFSQGRYEDAWELWMNALRAYEQKEPALDRVLDKGQFVDSSEFYYYASVVSTIQQKTDEAVAILKKALAFNPQDTLVLNALAAIYWEKKDECLGGVAGVDREKAACHWQAMEFFRQAESLLQGRLERYRTYFNLRDLGDLYLTVGEYDKARGFFKQAETKDARAAYSWAKLGVIELRQKRPDRAIPLFEEALKRSPDDLEMMNNLAEAHLRAEKLDEAETRYRQVLAIAPNHVQSLIGLGEVCTARGEKNDPDRYSEATKYYSDALELANEEKKRSKYLKKAEKAAVYYSLGYARVQLYETSGIRRDASMLKQARQDFLTCRDFNPTHQKALRAIEKLEDRLAYFSPEWLTEKLGPLSIFTASILIFLAVQLTFFILPIFNKPSLRITETSLQAIGSQLPKEVAEKLNPLKNQEFSSEEALLDALQLRFNEDKQMQTVKSWVHSNINKINTEKGFPKIDGGYYVLLTFGLLLFMVVGLYLPQVLKLKVAGIELEKGTIDQARAGGILGISK